MMSYGNAEAVLLAGGRAAPAAGWIDPASTAEPANLGRLVLDLTRRRQRGGWAMQLDAAVAAAPDRLVIVAHGLACAAFAFWAQLTPHPYLQHITGALLIEPVRPAKTRAFSFMRSPKLKLPFPSLLLSTRPDGHDGAQLELAANWGSQLVTPRTLEVQARPWFVGAAQLPLVAASE